MLNIPVAVQDLFKTDGIPKNFRVHFPNGERTDITNDMIVKGSVKFTESVCSKDVLQFGLAEASEIQFECVGVENIYGMTIQCAIEIEIGNEIQNDPDIDDTLSWLTPQYVVYSGVKYYRIPYGEFVVESCPRQHGAMKHRRVQGYGRTVLDYIDFGGLFNRFVPFTKYQITDVGLECMLNPEMFEKEEAEFGYEYTSIGNPAPLGSIEGFEGIFYNQSGTEIKISVQGYTPLDSPPLRQGIARKYTFSKDIRVDDKNVFVNADALYLQGSYDAEKYAQVGQFVLDYVESNELDILYNKNKKKIYSSTEQAIRKAMPYLFEPCINLSKIVYEQIKKSGSTSTIAFEQYSIDNGWSVNENGYTITPAPYSKGISGEYPQSNLQSFEPMFVYLNYPQGSTCTVRYYVGSTAGELATYSGDNFETNFTEIKACYVPDTSPIFSIAIRPTLKVKNYYHSGHVYNSAGNAVTPKLINGSAYSNSVSVKGLLLGIYELQAKFGRVGRHGEVEAIGLSKSGAVPIQKNDYSDLWWDEYQVDGIGSVRYTFGENNEQYEYVFGSGQSVYDMTDNELLKHIVIPEEIEKSSDYINGLIDEYFVPNVQDIPFVPVDLEARGLPYLESGDYIVIDNDDGGTVGTYILERSISGVHSLEDDIDSKGGEIIGSDVRSI